MSKTREVPITNLRSKITILLAAASLAVINSAATAEDGRTGMKLTCPEFENNKYMPKRFGLKEDNVNPALLINNIPPAAKSLTLIVDDPDAPAGTWLHWIVYDIQVIPRIEEDSVPGKQGINSFHKKDYGGPCPPSGTHRYFFKVYALDKELGLKEGVDINTLKKAMEGHILEEAELVGLYKR